MRLQPIRRVGIQVGQRNLESLVAGIPLTVQFAVDAATGIGIDAGVRHRGHEIEMENACPALFGDRIMVQEHQGNRKDKAHEHPFRSVHTDLSCIVVNAEC